MTDSKDKSFYSIITLLAYFWIIAGGDILAAAEPYASGTVFALKFFSAAAYPMLLMVWGAKYFESSQRSDKVPHSGFLRITALALLFSFILWLIEGNYPGDVAGFLEAFISDPLTDTYSCLYIYIAFTLTAPFLRKMAKGLSALEKILFILIGGAVIAFTSVLAFFEVTEPSSLFIMPLFVAGIYFPVLGYIIEKSNIPENSSLPIGLGFALMAVLSGFAVYYVYNIRFSDETVEEFLTGAGYIFVLLFVFCAFYFSRCVLNKTGNALVGVLSVIGESAFFAFLIYAPVIAGVKIFFPSALSGEMSAFAELGVKVGAYFVSLLAARIIMFVPPFRKAFSN